MEPEAEMVGKLTPKVPKLPWVLVGADAMEVDDSCWGWCKLFETMLAEDSADSSAKAALPTQWNKCGLATLGSVLRLIRCWRKVGIHYRWASCPLALNIFKCLFTEYSRLSLKMYVYVFSSVRDGHHNLICNCFQVFRVESPWKSLGLRRWWRLRKFQRRRRK